MAAQQPPDVVDQTETSKFKKRLSQHNLRVDIPSKEAVYAVPVQVSSATDPQCIEEGKELFSNFLQEEIEREGLQAPREIFTPIVSTPVGYRNPLWAKTGRELRMLADAFSKTKERERVRRRADEFGCRAVDYEQFSDLLTELFDTQGFTRERIVLLFFFCSDLAIKNLREKALSFFQQCLEWSMKFISDRVCNWVQEHGGWEVVLANSVEYFTKLVAIGTIAFVSITLYRWFMRRL